MFAHDLPSGPHEIELSIKPGIEPQSAFSNSVSIDHPSQSNIILMNPFLDDSFHSLVQAHAREGRARHDACVGKSGIRNASHPQLVAGRN